MNCWTNSALMKQGSWSGVSIFGAPGSEHDDKGCSKRPLVLLKKVLPGDANL
jgi:hypothetical protein